MADSGLPRIEGKREFVLWLEHRDPPCLSRRLAEEWTYGFLSSTLADATTPHPTS